MSLWTNTHKRINAHIDTSIGISIIKKRESCHCVIFMMWIPVLGKAVYILKQGPDHSFQNIIQVQSGDIDQTAHGYGPCV